MDAAADKRHRQCFGRGRSDWADRGRAKSSGRCRLTGGALRTILRIVPQYGMLRERPTTIGESALATWSDASLAQLRHVAESWLAALEAALASGDYARAAAMVHSDGYWRDLLTFGWEFKTCHGAEAVRVRLAEVFAPSPGRNFRLEGEPALGALGEHRATLEFFFRFETPVAHGRGFVRLVEDAAAPGAAKAFTLLTTMQELKGFPESAGRNRPREDLRTTAGEPQSWRERREAARSFKDKDPDVIVIGAGQSGLMMAARLTQLNVSTLVVERTERIGDIWRKRYASLKLHNEICMNHFAYMPFPDTWPVFIPKDKLADWLAFYAESMELNVWTGTALLDGRYDGAETRWTVRLRLADGSIRTMRPCHIVLAAGVSGLPSIPALDGMDGFRGTIVHSSGDTDSLDVAGKAVLVVGAGTSAHDIAQNLHYRGADVTMLQRSSITVCSLEPSSVRPYELYRRNDGVRPIADTDMIAASVPYDLLARLHRPLSRQMQEDDKELLDGLRQIGFLLDNGEDDTGYFLKLLRYQAGYYLNIGCSDLIVARKIKLKAGVDIARLTARQVRFSDGSAIDADIVVLATGYKPLQESVRAMFGDAVADRVGPIWGIGADGELNAMYARTAQEGFYVTGGGLPGARAYSLYTAMLIKAALEGLLPPRKASATAQTTPELHHA
jgi:cation diffusion facilitator CzcD-associated flavoprotein CzcO